MKVCLIDEDEIVTKVLSDFLSELGNEVVSSLSILELPNNPSKETTAVDLVIVDPGMLQQEDAVRVIRDIHERYRGADIVVVSSVLPFGEAISQGVYAYLRKPIRLEELELLLSRLEQRRNNRGPNKGESNS